MALNDEAWDKIFTTLSLLDDIDHQGFVYVTAVDLKRASGGREPRLLAKIDKKNLRPEIFKHHKLSILPVENGKYIIFKDELSKTYFSLEAIFSAISPEVYLPGRDFGEYQSLDIRSISSESQAIDYANLVSLLKTFTGEHELNLTIRGRLRSGTFSVNIIEDHHNVQVAGVQIEVDAGYESPERIYILEAKIGRIEDFNIRQLYYPYKDWTQKTLKEVIPLIFIYTNGLFYFLQFSFGTEYGELHFVRGKCYTINDPVKQRVDLQNLIQSIELEPEPDVPYPQANDLDKVIDLVTNYPNGLTNKTAITEFFEFDERQGDYYANAAIYLGFLKRGRSRSSEFEITKEGEYMARNSRNRSQRNLLLLIQMLKKPSFREIIIQCLAINWNLSSLNPETIAPIIQRHIELNDTTAKRRSSTVISWLKWIKDVIEFIP
jgi:hypothetical protein